MKVVSIQANTEVCKQNFISTLEELIELVKNDKAQLSIVAALQSDGSSKWADYSSMAGFVSYQMIGFVDMLKDWVKAQYNG